MRPNCRPSPNTDTAAVGSPGPNCRRTTVFRCQRAKQKMPWPSGLSSEYWSYLQYYCKERKQNLSGFFGREMTKSLGTVERGAFEGLKTEEVFHLCGRKLLIDIVPFWTPPVFVLFCCTFLQRHF